MFLGIFFSKKDNNDKFLTFTFLRLFNTYQYGINCIALFLEFQKYVEGFSDVPLFNYLIIFLAVCVKSRYYFVFFRKVNKRERFKTGNQVKTSQGTADV